MPRGHQCQQAHSYGTAPQAHKSFVDGTEVDILYAHTCIAKIDVHIQRICPPISNDHSSYSMSIAFTGELLLSVCLKKAPSKVIT